MRGAGNVSNWKQISGLQLPQARQTMVEQRVKGNLNSSRYLTWKLTASASLNFNIQDTDQADPLTWNKRKNDNEEHFLCVKEKSETRPTPP
jgi:hypothetical protein